MVANLEFSHCSLLTSSLFYVNIKSKNPNKNQKVYGASRGGLPYERDGDARREILIKTLKETNLGVAQALFDP